MPKKTFKSLLSKQLVVDRVKIDGIRANIKRYKDGSTNFDDFLSKEESSQQIQFDIDSVHLANAHILFDDQKEARRPELDKLSLDTGKVANGVPSTLQLEADIKADKPAQSRPKTLSKPVSHWIWIASNMC